MNESFPNPSESQPRTLAEIAIPIQAMLALQYYHRLHPEDAVDALHPDMVDRSIRGKAMELWLDKQSGEALSAKFRSYIEDPEHGKEEAPLSDLPALDRILDAISTDPDTVH